MGLVLDALNMIAHSIPGLTASDGPLRQQVTQRDVLVIGDPAITGAGWAVDEAPMPTFGGIPGYRERITIWCSFLSWDGGKTIKPRRDRCIEVLGLIRSAIDPVLGDPTLGDACEICYLGGKQRGLPANDDDGASQSVVFPIICETTI